MDEQISAPGLQLDEDIGFQRRFRIAQRVAWVIAGLVIIVALLGLFGSGPLTGAVAGESESGLQLHYQRFARYQSPTSFQVDVVVSDPTATQAVFWIERSSLKHYEVEGVSPEPESIEVAGDRLVYAFQIAPETELVEVVMRVQPDEFGLITLRLGTGESELIDVTQIVYP